MTIKKVLSVILVLVFCSFSMIGFAQGESQSQLDVYHINNEDDYMKFYLDGSDLSFYTGYGNASDIYEAINGTTFMKLRNLGDALNISLYWHQSAQEVSFDANGKSVILKLGSKKAYVGGREVILNVAPFAKEGRTFVPLRFVSEALGIRVNYIDMRPEGEFAKQAIVKNYPNIKRIISLGSFREGNKIIFNRLRVDSYNPSLGVIGVVFEEVDKYSHSKTKRLNWFEVNINKHTIYDQNQRKITVDWYEKGNNKEESTGNRYDPSLGEERNIPYRVKDYLVNGQGHLSTSQGFWWNDTHLEALTDETINGLYSNFLESGGNGNDIKDFAEYLSLNAPPYPHWKKVFENSILSDWKDIKITKYDESYDSEYVEVYIEDFEPVFVNVNTITGYYSGL